jgi:hypothetical protein
VRGDRERVRVDREGERLSFSNQRKTILLARENILLYAASATARDGVDHEHAMVVSNLGSCSSAG